MIDELREWYAWGEGCDRPVPVGCPEFLDDAESFKTSMMRLGPTRVDEFFSVVSKNPAFWNRVALHRMRAMAGRSWFVVVRTLDEAHRLLVLKVPPRGLRRAARLRHASAQMTYRDDMHSRYVPGLRVSDEVLDVLSPCEREYGSLYVDGGFPMEFVSLPERYVRDNYRSYYDHSDLSDADIQRQLDAGWLEGPLHYTPWVVNPQAGIYLPEKDKYRPVMDCTRSGLNASLRPSTCKYDMLEDVLRLQTPDCLNSGFDLKDAFYNWPRRQEHCDYLGVRDTRGRSYRYRFTSMGLADSPRLQTFWAEVLKRHLNSVVVPEPGSGVRSSVTGMFVDDGHVCHPAPMTAERAASDLECMMRELERLGVQESVRKRVMPTRAKDYVGALIMTDTHPLGGSVTVQPERGARYARAIHELLEEHSLVGSVSRVGLASLVGKLQFTAKVVPGGQLLLSFPYRSLSRFVDPASEYGDWGESVRVTLDAGSVSALRAYRQRLLGSPSRRYYCDDDIALAGFWEGVHNDSHGYLDEHSHTSRGIPVITTDASGTACGGWFGSDRFVHHYPAAQCAPNMSSNYRELDGFVRGLRRWGSCVAGGRVLLRGDNTTAVRVVNRRGTMAPALHDLCEEVIRLADEHQADVAGGHLPGELNVLADGLSRHVRARDTGDWMFCNGEFESVREEVFGGTPYEFTLDGAADPAGTNARVPRFCSELEPFQRRDIRGEHVWCNPDFLCVDGVLRHFLAAYGASGGVMSGTFVLPVWPGRSWWRFLKGARLVRAYPKGVRLFTSPDWQGLMLEGGGYRFGGARVWRGPTPWPVIVVHFPPVVAGGVVSPMAGRPVLTGDPVRDVPVCRGLWGERRRCPSGLRLCASAADGGASLQTSPVRAVRR